MGELRLVPLWVLIGEDGAGHRDEGGRLACGAEPRRGPEGQLQQVGASLILAWRLDLCPVCWSPALRAAQLCRGRPCCN